MKFYFLIFFSLVSHAEDRSFRIPQYYKQVGISNYSTDLFSTPSALRKDVDFWKFIYTQLSEWQGVLHDQNEVGQIYELLDFTDLKNLNRNEVRKAIEMEQRLKRAMKEITERRKACFDFRFQRGLKEKTETAFYLSGKYSDEFEKIFSAEQVPLELTRLVFVESSYQVLARSKVGASGLWQLMPTVAPRLITSSTDLRNEPYHAAKVAAKLLKQNFNFLQDWRLATVAYNHGAQGVRNITRRFKTNALEEILETSKKKRGLGFASRNFYSCFLAILEIEKKASVYFPGLKWAASIPNQPILLITGMHYQKLLAVFGNDARELQVWNPHLNLSLKQQNWIPPRTQIFVPETLKEILVTELQKPKSKKTSQVEAPD